jgi:hypothetical protein
VRNNLPINFSEYISRNYFIHISTGLTNSDRSVFLVKHIFLNKNLYFIYRVSQKWRTNGALRCRRDYRKRQKNVKKILLDLLADLAVFESGT